MARGAEFLGSEWAILCGAMSWVSERNLVSAISNAGGFGVIACGAMTPELLDGEIAGTRALAKKPFGVNLITMHPQLFELIEVCAKHKVGHVVLAGLQAFLQQPAIERRPAGGGQPCLVHERREQRAGRHPPRIAESGRRASAVGGLDPSCRAGYT